MGSVRACTQSCHPTLWSGAWTAVKCHAETEACCCQQATWKCCMQVEMRAGKCSQRASRCLRSCLPPAMPSICFSGGVLMTSHNCLNASLDQRPPSVKLLLRQLIFQVQSPTAQPNCAIVCIISDAHALCLLRAFHPAETLCVATGCEPPAVALLSSSLAYQLVPLQAHICNRWRVVGKGCDGAHQDRYVAR
jgi:hypothetical protein